MRTANLKLKPSKFNLFQRDIVVIGHVVSESEVHTDPTKPRLFEIGQNHVWTILYYYDRRFVKGFASIASTLNQVFQKNKKFYRTDGCTELFQKLKDTLVSTQSLTYLVPGQRLYTCICY